MKIIDLQGRTLKWNPTGQPVYGGQRVKSQYHLKCRGLLKALYPTMNILEEVGVPIRQGVTYYLDFYIPLTKTVVEVHGPQHYEYSSLFHKTTADFALGQKRDANKKEWCEINGINFIELSYREDLDEWTRKLFAPTDGPVDS